jgi:myo-inositol-1(or 4)-monophosphatase
LPASDLPLLIEAAREAGKIATRYTGESAKRWDKPGGLGPVTEADMAVNAMLERDLRAARPGYGWLSEETEDGAGRLAREHVFIVDPIDGTRSFIDGSATWAHSLAVADKGIVTAAVIYLPLRDKLYAAAAGQGTTLNDAPVAVSPRADLSGAHIIAAKPNLDPKNWKGGRVPDVRRAHRPSLAYRLSLVAEGRFDAMLTLRRSWEWDIAAGDLILREAGAVTSDRTGQPLRFNNAEPLLNGVVAAGPALHAAVIDRLA